MHALRSALVIAHTTLLEAIRNRILMVALAFAVALVVLSVSAAAVSLGERARLIVDVGLAAASAMGSLIAVALTIASFGRELDRHTAYPVLARPVPRWAFVLGKYLGVLSTMAAVVSLMLLATASAIWIYGDVVPAAFWASLWLTCLEMAVVVAVALLFSCYTSPVLAAVFSVALLIAGNLADDVYTLAARLSGEGHSLAGAIVAGIYYVVPDLAQLSLRLHAANDLVVPSGFVLWATAYGGMYATAAVILSMVVFDRRRAV